MSYIYKVVIGVDTFGGTSNYSMRVFKFTINSETNSNYILLGERHRVKKKDINVITNGMLDNSVKNIQYLVWVLNKEDISIYKEKIIEKIKDTIKEYKLRIGKLEDLIQGNNLKIMLHDESDPNETKRTEIKDDVF